MAETSYPNPGVTQVQHERLMGGAAASGVFGHPSDTPVVYAPGSGTREVRIRASRRATVEGYGWENDAVELVKNLAANTSGSARTDLVVLRLDRAAWTVTVQVVQGTPGAGAPSPSTSTGTSGTYEVPLAEVIVDNNATTIAAGKVTNRAWYIGADGQIRCTATTLPPHEAGRTVWLHPEGRYQVSSGNTWMTAVEDSGEVSVSLVSGYTATENKLQRVNGVCVLNLKVAKTSGTIPPNTATKVATLPADFWPTFDVQGTALYSSAAGLAVGLKATDAGNVYVVTPPTVAIDPNRTVDGSLTWIAA